MAKWEVYTGSDEQIEGMLSNVESSGVLLIGHDGYLYKFIRCSRHEFMQHIDKKSKYQPKSYLICEPHPYADIIKIWADTGCEVYVCEHHSNYYDGILESTDCFYHPPTNKPDWNIPNAEYRLTPFEEEKV